MVVGGDDYSVHNLFQRLIEGLVDSGWVKNEQCGVVPSRVSVVGSRTASAQLEQNCGRLDVGNAFSFLPEQSGFKARQNFHRVSIVTLSLLSGCYSIARSQVFLW